MPEEKQDYESNFEELLLDSESRIMVANDSELGDEARGNEVTNAIEMYKALTDREAKRNERLKIEKDTEVRLKEIRADERKEYVKDVVIIGGTVLTTWCAIKNSKALLKFEETGTLMSNVSKEWFRNVTRSIGSVFHF